MLSIGIAGGFDLVTESRDFLFPFGWFHDAAAVLVEDGKVVAAIEEERLNRIKHTNKGAVSSIRFCLDRRGLRLKDLDRLAIYGNEEMWNAMIRGACASMIDECSVSDIRGLVHSLLARALGEDVDDDRMIFVPHHLCHAVSAYAQSGFDNSLVLTIDGAGDDIAGLILHAYGQALSPISAISVAQSLGIFYLKVIQFLGFGMAEEYKVMGLAPYGDRERYRALFRSFYELLPYGNYVINWDFSESLRRVTEPRKRRDDLRQVHWDLAAALQGALRDIVFHVLRYYRLATNHTKLCLAGGVAHNCTLNGELLYSGMFRDVFVQPASHDAGCAIGASLLPFFTCQARPFIASLGSGFPTGLVSKPLSGNNHSQIEDVFWGTDIGDSESILERLKAWGKFVCFERQADIAGVAARKLADGSILGWVQGRSEFGPRALGNRSILADPRPAENKDIINAMVKKREAFRPFAPSILEEYAAEFFELPNGRTRFPFMTFVVKTRTEKRDLLKATTHVDGTARIQTVSKGSNSRFWELIEEFRKITGIPVLLNTSFNNNAEPIVDSVDDAIVCFLTTDLHYLVIGDYLISKNPLKEENCLSLVPVLASYSSLVQTRRRDSHNGGPATFEIRNGGSGWGDTGVSEAMFHLLSTADGSTPVGNLLRTQGLDSSEQRNALLNELIDLWSQRTVVLRPCVEPAAQATAGSGSHEC